jgi:hypothetical protein
VSDTQIIIVLAVGVSVIVVFACVVLVVLARLRRVVKSQFETLDSLVSALRTGEGRDKPGDPSS